MEIVKVRQVSMFFLREFTRLSLNQIGGLFGRDHATVLHSIKQVHNHCDTEKDYREQINQVRCILIRYAKFQRCDNMPINYVLMGTFGKEMI
jgi:hypothetical protein